MRTRNYTLPLIPHFISKLFGCLIERELPAHGPYLPSPLFILLFNSLIRAFVLASIFSSAPILFMSCGSDYLILQTYGDQQL